LGQSPEKIKKKWGKLGKRMRALKTNMGKKTQKPESVALEALPIKSPSIRKGRKRRLRQWAGGTPGAGTKETAAFKRRTTATRKFLCLKLRKSRRENGP